MTTPLPATSQSWGYGGWPGMADPHAFPTWEGSENAAGAPETAELASSSTGPPDTRLTATTRPPPLQGAGDPWIEAAQRLVQAATASRNLPGYGDAMASAAMGAQPVPPVGEATTAASFSYSSGPATAAPPSSAPHERPPGLPHHQALPVPAPQLQERLPGLPHPALPTLSSQAHGPGLGSLPWRPLEWNSGPTSNPWAGAPAGHGGDMPKSDSSRMGASAEPWSSFVALGDFGILRKRLERRFFRTACLAWVAVQEAVDHIGAQVAQDVRHPDESAS